MKYLKDNDTITIRAKKGTKDRWQEYAKKQGKSLTRFIKDTIEKEIEGF